MLNTVMELGSMEAIKELVKLGLGESATSRPGWCGGSWRRARWRRCRSDVANCGATGRWCTGVASPNARRRDLRRTVPVRRHRPRTRTEPEVRSGSVVHSGDSGFRAGTRDLEPRMLTGSHDPHSPFHATMDTRLTLPPSQPRGQFQTSISPNRMPAPAKTDSKAAD